MFSWNKTENAYSVRQAWTQGGKKNNKYSPVFMQGKRDRFIIFPRQTDHFIIKYWQKFIFQLLI